MRLKYATLLVVFVTIWLPMEPAYALFEAESTFESFYTAKGLVPLHRGFDRLKSGGHRRTGRFSGSTSTSRHRARPGVR